VVPPDAEREKEYALPDCAPAMPDVVMLNDEVSGFTATVALDFLVVSATLVAVTVAFELLVTVGAVNMPPLETDPAEADQVTAVLLVPWTTAENC
jgi:hypothetical protein